MNLFFSILILILAKISSIIALPGKLNSFNKSQELSYKTGRWTSEEDLRLIQLYEQYKNLTNVWKVISYEFNRNPELIRKHYNNVVDPTLKRKRDKWTEQENEIILDAMKKSQKPFYFQIKWVEIARQLKRSLNAVHIQKKKLKKDIEVLKGIEDQFKNLNKTNSSGTFFKRGVWSREEDEKLLALYDEHKDSLDLWNKISTVLNRPPYLIRQHYLFMLDPKLKRSRAEWTEEETQLILKEKENAIAEKRRPLWAHIARKLNRTSLSVNIQSKRLEHGKLKSHLNSRKSSKKFESSSKNKQSVHKYKSGYWTPEEDAKVLELYKQHKGSHRSTNQIWEDISLVLKRNPRRIQDRFNGILNPKLLSLEFEKSEEENRTYTEEFKRYFHINSDWHNNSHFSKKIRNDLIHQKDRIKKFEGTRKEGQGLINNSVVTVNSVRDADSVEIPKNIIVANPEVVRNIVTTDEPSSIISFDDELLKVLNSNLISDFDQEIIHDRTDLNYNGYL